MHNQVFSYSFSSTQGMGANLCSFFLQTTMQYFGCRPVFLSFGFWKNLDIVLFCENFLQDNSGLKTHQNFCIINAKTLYKKSHIELRTWTVKNLESECHTIRVQSIWSLIAQTSQYSRPGQSLIAVYA